MQSKLIFTLCLKRRKHRQSALFYCSVHCSQSKNSKPMFNVLPQTTQKTSRLPCRQQEVTTHANLRKEPIKCKF